MILLVPNDVLRPRRPDEHFAAEADLARANGMDVALVDHDALTTPDGAAKAVAKVNVTGEAVYRGWMLRAEQYAAFEKALAERDVRLLTTAAEYQRAHELPGWYEALKDVTPETKWTVGDARVDFERACAELGAGPAVLRDYTKSMKHYWHEAAFIPDVADVEAAWRVASRFRELRDDDLVGGFVLRRFEEFTSAEVRTWWVDGECRLVGPHPDSPDDLPGGVELVAPPDLPFVTVDLALRADGVWRVIELGDGQVSDRPSTVTDEDWLSVISRNAASRASAVSDSIRPSSSNA